MKVIEQVFMAGAVSFFASVVSLIMARAIGLGEMGRYLLAGSIIYIVMTLMLR